MNMKAELREKFGDFVTTGALVEYNREYMRRARAGELELKSRGIWDLSDENAVKAPKLNSTKVKESKIDAGLIRKRFAVLGTLADGVVAGNVRSLMVAGSAGVGKTYELEKKLEAAEKNGDIESFESIKGSISAAGLFQKLYHNKDEGQVLLLDDTDSMFSDEEAMNLLKAALDTSTVRKISWAKQARWLEDLDIPSTFEYEGQIVFITNTDPDAVVAKGGRIAPHMAALLSRSIFLDLCIHDAKAIMIRIEQVMDDSTLCADLKINDKEAALIKTWMNTNINALRSVSIRTVIQLAGFIKTSKSDWQDLASVTLLKGN